MARPRVRRTAKGVLINGKLREPDFSATREVHFVGRYVVKIDKTAQNWKEWRTWTRRIKPEDRPFFAPVLAFGGAGDKLELDRERREGFLCPSWLIQPRIRFRTGRISKANHAKVAELAARYGLDDLLTGDESSGQPHYVRNWGVSRDGTPVIFDYAL